MQLSFNAHWFECANDRGQQPGHGDVFCFVKLTLEHYLSSVSGNEAALRQSFCILCTI